MKPSNVTISLRNAKGLNFTKTQSEKNRCAKFLSLQNYTMVYYIVYSRRHAEGVICNIAYQYRNWFLKSMII